MYTTLDDWIQHETIPFSLTSSDTFDAAIDRFIALLDDSAELLGLGEPLHGGEEFLMLRNRLFQRLVETHGYGAIALESSFPKAYLVNEYVAGRGAASYDALQDTGFSHGSGKLEANRELVEWMRHYNADSAHAIKLQFYGFDSPTEMTSADSPRQLLYFVLDYLASLDATASGEYRQRVDLLLGDDAIWENPAAAFDPALSVGLSPAAAQLRIETEELISDLRVRRPELVAESDQSRYLQAEHYASMARQLLNYHAVMARQSNDRIAKLLGIRDAMMADNLVYIVSHERSRGKVLAFAHNSHMKRGKADWQLGAELLTWWPAGAHLNAMLGTGYIVIGTAVGISQDNGIGQPEPGTLEARLIAASGLARLIPTHNGEGLPGSVIAGLPTRSGSLKNPSYFVLTSQSFTDFDWLCVIDSTVYNRGGPQLQS